MTNRLVTIVITTYRRPAYLLEAMESALKQTYEPIELIVVDDNGRGTPDQLATADAVAGVVDPRVRYIALERNGGASVARNTGIENANGFYVAFLDDDDIILPEKIEKQVRYLEERGLGYGGCGTWLKRFFENGAEFELKPPDGIDVFKAAIRQEQTYQTSTFLFRRQALLDIGMFDPVYRNLEDPELIIRLSLRFDYGIVEEILTLVRSRKMKVVAEWEELWNLKLLEKYRDEIARFSRAERRDLLFIYYFNLSKKFLQNRKPKRAFYYFVKCGNPARYVIEFITSGFAYIKRNRDISR